MTDQNFSFEAAMQRLEQIVRAMERGDVELEESLKLFQEGTALIARCGKLLDHARMEVKKVLVTSDGTPAEEDFPNGL